MGLICVSLALAVQAGYLETTSSSLSPNVFCYPEKCSACRKPVVLGLYLTDVLLWLCLLEQLGEGAGLSCMLGQKALMQLMSEDAPGFQTLT